MVGRSTSGTRGTEVLELGLRGTALEYFDTEKFARDLEASGDVSEAWYDGEYYVFRSW
ncbi:putative antirestriction protein [Mycobacterium phage Swirley]|uniref:Antirestriction protein n=1 Tax=Mycobacterium phage Swirley TaxID=1527534 RepID=A0A076YPL7_9CAUD|nr:putative antirestriction protein [Mycobacterium phage Swirley]AIK68947.1 putative antirestriction protein [Mycobacterium phage Swirley]